MSVRQQLQRGRRRSLIFLALISCVLNQIKFVNSKGTPSGLYTDDGDGHTILTQKFSKSDIKEISFDILSLMGFHHRPHPNLVESKSPASEFLLEVYNSLAADLDFDLSNGRNINKQNWNYKGGNGPKNLTWSQFNVDKNELDAISEADSIISFSNRGHKFSDRLKSYEEEKQFWFDVSEINPSTVDVLGAELRLWKNTNLKKKSHNEILEDFDGEVLKISVKQIGRGFDSGSFEERELDEIVTAKWEQGWLRFNVTKAFKKWIENPSENFGLVISTKRVDSGLEVPISEAGLASILDKEEHQPFLVSFLKGDNNLEKVHLPPIKRNRIRRSANVKQKRNNKKAKKNRPYDYNQTPFDRSRSACSLGMLYVNFEDLGWKDWIIAPDGYIAYYCFGECSFPLTASMNATNHAIVSTLVHTYYPLEYPKPSCAPSKLGSISMLYYDDNSNVTVKKYKDMTIKSCGCK